MFPRNFPVYGEVANLLPTFVRAKLLQTYCGLVVYVADLLQTCYGEVGNLLRGNWCNGFWPYLNSEQAICHLSEKVYYLPGSSVLPIWASQVYYLLILYYIIGESPIPETGVLSTWAGLYARWAPECRDNGFLPADVALSCVLWQSTSNAAVEFSSWAVELLYLSVLYDVDIKASACVLSFRYAMLCYAYRMKRCTTNNNINIFQCHTPCNATFVLGQTFIYLLVINHPGKVQ